MDPNPTRERGFLYFARVQVIANGKSRYFVVGLAALRTVATVAHVLGTQRAAERSFAKPIVVCWVGQNACENSRVALNRCVECFVLT